MEGRTKYPFVRNRFQNYHLTLHYDHSYEIVQVRKLGRQVDELIWESGCGDEDSEVIEMKNKLNSIIGFHMRPIISNYCFGFSGGWCPKQ